MKSIVFFGLGMALVVNCLSVHANDTAAQAAARGALEEKLKELGQPQTQPAPRTPSWADVKPTDEPASAKTIAVVQPKPLVQQTNPAAMTTVAVVPSPVASAAPIEVQPPAPAATPSPVVSVAPPAPVVPTPPKPIAAPPAVKTAPPAPAKPASQIVTLYGTTYKNAQVEKVDPDGIIISYSTSGGGMGMTKVYFTDLPDEYLQHYR